LNYSNSTKNIIKQTIINQLEKYNNNEGAIWKMLQFMLENQRLQIKVSQ
jgi:hypothetical protein